MLIFEREGQKRSNNFKNYKSLVTKQRFIEYFPLCQLVAFNQERETVTCILTTKECVCPEC